MQMLSWFQGLPFRNSMKNKFTVYQLSLKKDEKSYYIDHDRCPLFNIDRIRENFLPDKE